MIPKILYHGTSQTRLELIKLDGVMKANMKRFFKIDAKRNMGYLYFTDNLDDAWHCAIMTYLCDLRMSEYDVITKAYGFYNLAVLTLMTSNIRKGFEIDPEYYDYKDNKNVIGGTWYRYEGDILAKYFISPRTAPFSSINEEVIDGFNFEIDAKIWRDLDAWAS